MQLEHDTKKTQAQKVTFRRTHRRPTRTVRTSGPSVPVHSARVPLRSNTTGLVFQAILGAAACLALVGVVAQTRSSNAPGTSPDAPPPTVFVQLD